MGSLKNIFIISCIVYASIKINSFFKPPEISTFDDNAWWGPGKRTVEDKSIKLFKIHVFDKVLQDLKHRLENTKPFTPPLEGIQQQYGINTNLLQDIVTYWKTEYNWREREKFINKYPQYVTQIQGLQIHFIHVRPDIRASPNLRVVPILLLHGWPGSVLEFYDIIPLLTTPKEDQDFVFEVVVPSLPGYGFSHGAAKPGLGAAQIAIMFNNLMKRLNHEKYYVQGGDWGSIIGSIMATLYPENVLGYHSNMCVSSSRLSNLKMLLGSIYPPLIVDKQFEHKMYPLSKTFSDLLSETGYMHLQATKPDTIGVALKDSPVGLAAYILEKFSTWTVNEWINRQDAGLKIKYNYDALLDNIMFYWISGSITTSMRLYAETFNKEQMSVEWLSIPVKIPTACSKFKNELSYQANSILKDRFYNLVEITEHLDGGHFAAMEVPNVLAKDIWSSIAKIEKLYYK